MSVTRSILDFKVLRLLGKNGLSVRKFEVIISHPALAATNILEFVF